MNTEISSLWRPKQFVPDSIPFSCFAGSCLHIPPYSRQPFSTPHCSLPAPHDCFLSRPTISPLPVSLQLPQSPPVLSRWTSEAHPISGQRLTSFRNRYPLNSHFLICSSRPEADAYCHQGSQSKKYWYPLILATCSPGIGGTANAHGWKRTK